MNTIAHNISAMNAQRQFGINSRAKAKSIEKLSSGFRINRAADDAAGLAISEKMRGQIRGLSQGTRNVQDGISLLQVADGALSEVSEMLHRIKELSVQAANGTNTDTDREFLQDEVFLLQQAISEISEDTQFNTIGIFSTKTNPLIQSSGNIGNNGNSSVVDNTVTITNPNMMTESQAINELLSGQFSIDDTDIVMNGITISSDNLNGYFTTMSSKYLWNEFKGRQSDLNKKDEVTDIFNQIYQNLCITTLNETEQDNNPSNNGASNIQTSLTLARRYLDEAIHATNTSALADLAERYINEVGLNNYTVNEYELIKAAERYYMGLGGVDQPTPDGSSYLYIANSIGDYSMNYSMGYLVKDLGVDAYNLPSILTTSTDTSLVGSYIAWSNIFAGYDENGEKEVIVTPGQPTLPDPPEAEVFDDSDDVLRLWIQAGANEGQGMWLTIDNMSTSLLGINDVDVSTVDGATNAIISVKEALAKVTKNRSKIGAQQNRLEHTFAREEIAVENLSASESRIRDADMALEMTEYAKINILEQVSQSMMAQANQNERRVLDLLSM